MKNFIKRYLTNVKIYTTPLQTEQFFTTDVCTQKHLNTKHYISTDNFQVQYSNRTASDIPEQLLWPTFE